MKRFIYSIAAAALLAVYRDHCTAERFCGSFPSARDAARRTLDG